MTTTFTGTLKLTIVDAKDLKDKNFGKKDPYCNVSLGTAGLGGILDGQGIGKERFKTKTHESGGTHPKWNESHLFDLQGMKPEVRLKVALYDHDMFKDDYLGRVEITLAELIKHKDDLHYWDLVEKGKSEKVVGRLGLIAKFDCVQIPDSLREGQYVEHKESTGMGEKIQHFKDKITGKEKTEDKAQVSEPTHHRHHAAGDLDKFGRDHNQPRMGVSDNETRKGENVSETDRYRVDPGIIVNDPSQAPKLGYVGQGQMGQGQMGQGQMGQMGQHTEQMGQMGQGQMGQGQMGQGQMGQGQMGQMSQGVKGQMGMAQGVKGQMKNPIQGQHDQIQGQHDQIQGQHDIHGH